MPRFNSRSAHVAFVVHKVVLGHVSPCTVVSPCQLSWHQSSTFIHPSSWAGTSGISYSILRTQMEKGAACMCLSAHSHVCVCARAYVCVCVRVCACTLVGGRQGRGSILMSLYDHKMWDFTTVTN